MASIEKRGNKYKIVVSCGYDINNKQIKKSMTWEPSPDMTPKQIEKELQKQAILFEDKCESGQYMDCGIKFIDFAETWLKEHAEKQLKRRTVARYKEHLKRINLAIGHMRLDKIQPIHLMKLYDNLAESGVREDISYFAIADLNNLIKASKQTKEEFAKLTTVSLTTLRTACRGENVSYKTAGNIAKGLNTPLNKIFKAEEKNLKGLADKTILNYHRLISSIFTFAVQWQIILSNPCNRVKPPKVERKTARFLDDEQVAEMFKCLEHEPYQYKTMITVLVYTGFRCGELLGLKWSDIDFKNNLISVNKSMLYLPKVGTFEDSTKNTSSERVIKVSDIVIKVLKYHKAQQEIEKNRIGDKWNETGCVFTKWDGTPFNPDTLSRWFNKFIKRNNLPDVCIHSLRHTNATLLIANGVNLTTVANRLGHANANTTTKIYAHAIKTADEMAVAVLDDVILKASNI